MSKYDIDWSQCHNGVMLCSIQKTADLMPEVIPIINEFVDLEDRELNLDEYAVDVKVHMLMPNQWPCIPNWHRDFIPRGEDNKRDFKSDGITKEKMYAWISGPPFTEFKDKEGNNYFVEADKWHAFDQSDLHRGTMSEIHTWRCFIRVIPKKFIHPTTINIGTKRNHIQVYLDSNKFNW